MSLLVLAAMGCGSSRPTGQVAGRVLLEGEPLAGATIVFEDTAARVAVSANLAEDGSFTIRTAEQNGLPPGEYRVAVRPGMVGTGEAPLAGGPEESAASSGPKIPAKFHNSQTSGLAATVQEGANPPFEFDLSGSN